MGSRSLHRRCVIKYCTAEGMVVFSLFRMRLQTKAVLRPHGVDCTAIGMKA